MALYGGTADCGLLRRRSCNRRVALSGEQVVPSERPRCGQDDPRPDSVRDEAHQVTRCGERTLGSPGCLVDHDSGDAGGAPEDQAHRSAGRQEKGGYFGMPPQWHEGRRKDVRLGGLGPLRCMGHPRPSHAVASPNQNPDQQQRGIDGSEGLCQRTDREVSLTCTGVDAQHVPGCGHRDQDQPRRETVQRRTCSAAPRSWPWRCRRGPRCRRVRPPSPRPQHGVDAHDTGEGDTPGSNGGCRVRAESADPTAPRTERNSSDHEDATARHGTGIAPVCVAHLGQ